MPKTAKKSDSVAALYDSIFMELVPKIVDTNPELFRDRKKYWDYSEQQVEEFFGRLPEDYIGNVSEHRFRREKAAIFQCEGSLYNLTVGIKPPGYRLLIYPADQKPQPKNRRSSALMSSGKHLLVCPTFDLAFKPTDEEGARRIIQAGLEQFFLRQGDDTVGTLAAFGHKNKRVVHRDLELLSKFLPRGTIIEARYDTYVSNGQATYRI